MAAKRRKKSSGVEKDGRKEQTPLVSCVAPGCNYTCRGAASMGRHIKKDHPELSSDYTIQLSMSTAHELFNMATKSLSPSNQRAAEVILGAVRDYQLKLNLIVWMIAMARYERLKENLTTSMVIDQSLRDLIADEDPEDPMSPKLKLDIGKYFAESNNRDSAEIQSILNMKQTGSAIMDGVLAVLRAPDSETAGYILAKEERLTKHLGYLVDKETANSLRRILDETLQTIRGEGVEPDGPSGEDDAEFSTDSGPEPHWPEGFDGSSQEDG